VSRLDLLRSLLRGAAEAGAERLGGLRPVAGVRAAIAEVRARRATLTEPMLTAAISGAVDGAVGTTVSLRGGQIVVDLELEGRAPLSLGIVPELARFAPRGAKEVVFRVEPPDAVRDAVAREVVGALAGAIARALWGPILGPRPAGEHALVEPEGGRLRADLRTVPAVRSTFEGSPLAVALEVISIESFAVEDRALRLRIALPLPT